MSSEAPPRCPAPPWGPSGVGPSGEAPVVGSAARASKAVQRASLKAVIDPCLWVEGVMSSHPPSGGSVPQNFDLLLALG